LMSGGDTEEEGIIIQQEIQQLCLRGGFKLRKWSSNSQKILDNLPSSDRQTESNLEIQEDEKIKALGLYWNPRLDFFSFNLHKMESTIVTKRIVLSEISKIFDPLGWLAPLIINVKILIQTMWLKSLSWDESLPLDMNGHWNQFVTELQPIEAIKIPRNVFAGNRVDAEIHGFADASEKAYAAVIYVRCKNQDEYQTRLLCSKTKIAPSHRIIESSSSKVSLPKLELCGAVLLSRLMNAVKQSMRMVFKEEYAWTDSTVTLAWIQGHPSKWKTFIGNRVSEIQDLVPPIHWRHVKSGDNPADPASRGISAAKLVDSQMWWNGPQFLKNEIWKTEKMKDPETSLEIRRTKIVVAATTMDTEFFERFSSWKKLKRIIGFCLRFIWNSKEKGNRVNGCLSVDELRKATNAIIAMTQLQEYPKELKTLKSNQSLSSKSSIRGLHPFLDSGGVMRVGGRLEKANLEFNQKHPVLLPKNHAVTKLIILDEHNRMMHGNQQLLLASLRQKYWIVGARDMTRRLIHSCVRCHRLRQQTAQQLMGELPAHRIQESIRPFIRSGVDYAGPLSLKTMKGRGGKLYKAYICVFVCFATKAIHLELVGDLSTAGFLGALKRFISRRGAIFELNSDCGSNFVGANAELQKMLREAQTEKDVTELKDTLATEGIEWKFIPPGSPHFGGLWEAGVKATKYHLKRVVGEQVFTYEEMNSVLNGIEACLNSRPLSAISSEPEDYEALTLGHFLIGEPLTTIPEGNLMNLPMNRLSRWQLTQRMVQHFWDRWRNEYMNLLQNRPKWMQLEPDLKIGDLVLIKEENMPPLKWAMGRVEVIHPGTDKKVRVVTLKTVRGYTKRPITKLCLLPFCKNSE